MMRQATLLPQRREPKLFSDGCPKPNLMQHRAQDYSEVDEVERIMQRMRLIVVRNVLDRG